MKHAKKLVSILLVLAMALTLSVAAFAADTGSITVTNPHKEADGTYATYTAYKIFNLSYAGTAYTYTINSTDDVYNTVKEYADVEANGLTLTPSTDNNFVVTVSDTFVAAKFAAHLKDNIDDLGAGTALTKTGDTVSATELALGYYFVDSTLGTLCALTSTDADAEITEKNEEPTATKDVKEDSTNTWGEKNDAAIGETVEFRATITAKAGALNYILHDTMSNGLTFNNTSVVVTLNTATVGQTNYEVKVDDLADNCTFEVVFTQDFCDTLKDNDTIVVTYSAVVDSDAVIADTGNPNEIKLTYGENNEFETTPDTTTTYVWEFNIYKYTGETLPGTALANAKFKLSTDTTGNDVIDLVALGNNKYRVAKDGETNTVSEFTTDTTGKIEIEGLDEGTYYLHETEAPTGYNALTAPVTVIIDHSGNVKDSVNGEALENKTVNVENNTGTELPTTGGMGTTVLYVIGALLVVGAIVLLVSKKRMSMAEAAE
ncbi:MAG: SpaH/EbpB family LPXTG-anchored major pilin [Clostridia bacterium]|nr:SpaH/EbpB family LPXTG-anchored major pilin [Clostridia bacterium]